MENKYWYAVLRDEEDNDWGTGSYDYDEAVRMVEKWRARGDVNAYIAVIDEHKDAFCVDEIREF